MHVSICRFVHRVSESSNNGSKVTDIVFSQGRGALLSNSSNGLMFVTRDTL